MKSVTKMFIRAREIGGSQHAWPDDDRVRAHPGGHRGRVYGAYSLMGKDIGSLASGVDSALTNA